MSPVCACSAVMCQFLTAAYGTRYHLDQVLVVNLSDYEYYQLVHYYPTVFVDPDY